jgi:acyl phosphate:glycerol-3-phosphate acyltransferase
VAHCSELTSNDSKISILLSIRMYTLDVRYSDSFSEVKKVIDGTMAEKGSNRSITSRFVLTTPMKIAIILVTLALLFMTATSDGQRYGPILFYVYGSLPFAYIFTYLKTGKRIYEENSTNVGVANSYNTAGMLVGTLTVIGEISKGLLPLLMSYLLFGYSLEVTAYLLIGSLLGTNFSIFLKLKGGMGTTMMLWSFLFISPLLLLAILVLMVVCLKFMKKTYHVAPFVYAMAPILALTIDGRLTVVLLALYVAALYIIKFRPEMDDFRYDHGKHFSMGRKPKGLPPQDRDTPGP